jgi:hypothetical protein
VNVTQTQTLRLTPAAHSRIRGTTPRGAPCRGRGRDESRRHPSKESKRKRRVMHDTVYECDVRGCAVEAHGPHRIGKPLRYKKLLAYAFKHADTCP